MSKPEEKPEEKPVIEPWTPDKPIPEEEGETEAQRRHMLSRRMKYLDDPEAYESEQKKKVKKPKGGNEEETPKKPWLIGA